MLQVTISSKELWDESIQEFVDLPEVVLILEHSLISISKWESKWKKPFLTEAPKSDEELRDYVRCMTIKPTNIDDRIYKYISAKEFAEIKNYMDDPMTATTFPNRSGTGSKAGEEITSELVYYWLSAAQIPFEVQTWHINRLFILLRITSVKNQPAKKMSNKDTMISNQSLNAMRRARLGSKG